MLLSCSPSLPPVADAALSRQAPDVPAVVYVPPVADGCRSAAVTGFARLGDGFVVSEDTCSPGAGDEGADPSLNRIVAVRPDGTAEVGLPDGVERRDAVRVLDATPDGSITVETADAESFVRSIRQRSPQGAWSLLTAPAGPGDQYEGDGAPAAETTLGQVVDLRTAPDGSRIVAEPFAVRRLRVDGTVETLAGSDAADPPGTLWGGQGLGQVRPDPRPLPEGRVRARDIALPEITAMDVATDGTVWLAAHDVLLRLDPDGTIQVHASSSDVVPDGSGANLSGERGLYVSVSDLVVDGDRLLMLDEYSQRVLSLTGRDLGLYLGRGDQTILCWGDEGRAALRDAVVAPAACVGRFARGPDGFLALVRSVVALVADQPPS